MRGWIDGWRDPCLNPAGLYLVSDEVDLPVGITVFYDVHEVLEAWLCQVHMADLLRRSGRPETTVQLMTGDEV